MTIPRRLRRFGSIVRTPRRPPSSLSAVLVVRRPRCPSAPSATHQSSCCHPCLPPINRPIRPFYSVHMERCAEKSAYPCRTPSGERAQGPLGRRQPFYQGSNLHEYHSHSLETPAFPPPARALGTVLLANGDFQAKPPGRPPPGHLRSDAHHPDTLTRMSQPASPPSARPPLVQAPPHRTHYGRRTQIAATRPQTHPPTARGPIPRRSGRLHPAGPAARPAGSSHPLARGPIPPDTRPS